MNKSIIFKTVLLLILAVLVLCTILTITNNKKNVSGSQAETTAPLEQAGKTMPSKTLLDQFVVSGGKIVWFVLFPMSLIMVYLVVDNSLTIRRKKLLPKDASDRVVGMLQQHGHDLPEDVMPKQGDLLTTAVTLAVTRSGDDWFRAKSIISESLQDQALRLMRRIEWINLIGNVSPMVGLFGTVLGMIILFDDIAGGQTQPAQMADGISVALLTTFWGLFIAIPALAFHSVFRNLIESLVNDAIVEAESMMPQIRLLMKKPDQESTQPGKIPIIEMPTKPEKAEKKSSATSM
jgi:biopolymer transport protein ExbB